MKNFLYKVALGVCIAVCVAGVLSGFTALKDNVADWIGVSETTTESSETYKEGEEK